MTQVVQARCPGCQSLLRIPSDLLEQRMRCKHCQSIFQVKELDNGEDSIWSGVARASNPPSFFVPHVPARGRAYELWLSLLAVIGIGVLYWFLVGDDIPRPSSLVGHLLGIGGFLMMLSTETLYSLRKRWSGFHFGRMSTWLHIHIFTGIVGPFLILLHTGWRFHGLAGVLTLLVGVMVLSGFIGRYIYTAVPRSLEGVEPAVQEMQARIAQDDYMLRKLCTREEEKQALALVLGPPPSGWWTVFGRGFLVWRQRRRLKSLFRRSPNRAQAARLRQLLAERFRLQLQIHSLAGTRKLLALWHVIHIPMGVVVFTLAFVHIGAALYYATLMR